MYMFKLYQITTVSTGFSDGLEKVQKTGKQTNPWNYFRIFFQNWSLSKDKDVTKYSWRWLKTLQKHTTEYKRQQELSHISALWVCSLYFHFLKKVN